MLGYPHSTVAGPDLIPDDTRGIVAPETMMRHVQFERMPPPEALTGLVDWFWTVRWDLPMGFTHRQQVLSHPGVNVSIGNPPPEGTDPPPGPYPLRGVVNGVAIKITTRALTGTGWNVAAKTTTGGFGAWVDDVAALNDRAIPTLDLLGIDGPRLAGACDPLSFADTAGRLAAELEKSLQDRDPGRIAQAREVARIAAVAEHDRHVARVDELARLAGVTPRTLQRMFASCAGVSPTWVIRRYRLVDAAELVRDGTRVDWAEVAVRLGYADQAHLTRDFARAFGRTPAAYVRTVRADRSRSAALDSAHE